MAEEATKAVVTMAVASEEPTRAEEVTVAEVRAAAERAAA